MQIKCRALANHRRVEPDAGRIAELAKDVEALMLRIHRNARANGPEFVERSPERDRAAVAVGERLQDVIAAFADAKLGVPFDACPCCIDEQTRQRVEREPVLDLDEADIAGLIFSLASTVGTDADMPYFAPRFCSDGLGQPLYDVTLGFSKVAIADSVSGSPVRLDALRKFFVAQQRFVLAWPPVIGVFDSLNGIGNVYRCMAYFRFDADFFATWDSTVPGALADDHFGDLLGVLKFRKTTGSSEASHTWQPIDVGSLISWLRRPDIRERLSRSASMDPRPPAAGRTG